MEITLIVVGVIFAFFAIAFYVPRCFDEYDPYKPFNFYIALPAIGILFFAGSIFLMGASGNESSSIFFAVLVNVILCVIHIVVHARKYGIIFAIINYVIHTLLAFIFIMFSGIIICVYLLGLHLFTDMVSGVFSNIFDDDRD